jgi:hypothetical protein
MSRVSVGTAFVSRLSDRERCFSGSNMIQSWGGFHCSQPSKGSARRPHTGGAVAPRSATSTRRRPTAADRTHAPVTREQLEQRVGTDMRALRDLTTATVNRLVEGADPNANSGSGRRRAQSSRAGRTPPAPTPAPQPTSLPSTLKVVPRRQARPASGKKPVWGAGANVAPAKYRSTSAKCVPPSAAAAAAAAAAAKRAARPTSGRPLSAAAAPETPLSVSSPPPKPVAVGRERKDAAAAARAGVGPSAAAAAAARAARAVADAPARGMDYTEVLHQPSAPTCVPSVWSPPPPLACGSVHSSENPTRVSTNP